MLGAVASMATTAARRRLTHRAPALPSNATNRPLRRRRCSYAENHVRATSENRDDTTSLFSHPQRQWQCQPPQHAVMMRRGTSLQRHAGDPQRRRFGTYLYGFGTQWTGSLGLGPDRLFEDEAPELKSEEGDGDGMWQAYVKGYDSNDNDDDGEERHQSQRMVHIPLPEEQIVGGDGAIVSGERIATAAVGWGHSALVLQGGDEGGGIDNDATNDDSTTSDSTNGTNNDDKTDSKKRRLIICGRPHDFQAVLRLKRMPAFLRNFSLRQTLRSSTALDDPASNYQPAKDPLNRIATFFAGEELNFDEEEKRRFSIVPDWREVELPEGDVPAVRGDGIPDVISPVVGDDDDLDGGGATASSDDSHDIVHTSFRNTLAASAGFTAIIGRNTGTLYTFGLNHRGQCGVARTSNFIWTPEPVMGIGPSFAAEGRYTLQNEYPVVDVSLGLQHGLALDAVGCVYAWGKGERSQLGQGQNSIHENVAVDHALRVVDFCDPYYVSSGGGDEGEEDDDEAAMMERRLSPTDSIIRAIAAGMNHSAVITASNLPYVWGKNIAPPRPDVRAHRNKKVVDAGSPRYVPGLPPGVEIVDVTCGSHHTAFLLEDGSVYAMGVATDNAQPVVEEAVEVLPPGVIDGPVRSFRGHFDRTTIVAGGGESGGRRQVLEIQLWSHEELRRNGAVVPRYMGWLEEEERRGGGGLLDVREVHRGWMHTLVVAEERTP